MKSFILSIVCLVVSTYASSQTIAGVWDSGNENTKIEVLQEGGEWIGKIKSSDNKNAPVGKVILKDLEKQGEVWSGKLFLVKKQKWVNVKITPYQSKLDLLVSAGFSNREVQWAREKE